VSELKGFLEQSFKDGASLLETFVSDPKNIEKVVSISELFAKQFQSEKKGLICGNGGSACDAMHFAEEFTGRYRQHRRALPVISLTDPAHITCVGNDYGFESIFSRGVEAFGLEGDIFIGLSTSGNSGNIVSAVEAAKKKGLHTILLLGKDGGKLKGHADFEFVIQEKTSDRIQELHMIILHIIIEGVERILFPENY
jgi:D-sedoheptulose 7-phosphate isomerase